VAEVTLEFLGRQFAEMQDELTNNSGILRGMSGRLDGGDPRIGTVDLRLADFEARMERLEASPH
jgi:hypothetical protein